MVDPAVATCVDVHSTVVNNTVKFHGKKFKPILDDSISPFDRTFDTYIIFQYRLLFAHFSQGVMKLKMSIFHVLRPTLWVPFVFPNQGVALMHSVYAPLQISLRMVPITR